MSAKNKAGILITDPKVARQVGREPISPHTIWILNREAIAKEYGCTPMEVEQWPQYERELALKMLDIRAQAAKRRTSG